MEKSYGAFDFVWPLTLCVLYSNPVVFSSCKGKRINILSLPHCINFIWQKCIESPNFHLISVICK